MLEEELLKRWQYDNGGNRRLLQYNKTNESIARVGKQNGATHVPVKFITDKFDKDTAVFFLS